MRFVRFSEFSSLCVHMYCFFFLGLDMWLSLGLGICFSCLRILLSLMVSLTLLIDWCVLSGYCLPLTGFHIQFANGNLEGCVGLGLRSVGNVKDLVLKLISFVFFTRVGAFLLHEFRINKWRCS